jgi:hypothetical protein
MPDLNHMLTHPQLGPTLSAQSYISVPVVGATHTFSIRVTRKGSPVSGAAVTIRVYDSSDTQVYPTSGALTIPADPDIPGTYTYTPVGTGIFTVAYSVYKVEWIVVAPASGSLPQCTLPLTQRVTAQEP